MWRRLLPACVSFSSGFAPASAQLTPTERLSLGDAGAQRVREFAAGRWHARLALATLGIAPSELPRSRDGTPAWPSGVIGCIAHTVDREQIYAVAAVARTGQVAALGVDVEAPAPIRPRHWAALLQPAELSGVMTMPAPVRAAEVKALWCAKEAAAKAARSILDLRGVSVVRQGHDHFTAATAVPQAPAEAATAFDRDDAMGTRWVGRLASERGWAFAAVVQLRPVAGGDVGPDTW